MAEPAAIEVVQAGALTTLQDLGRPGFAHLGIPRSGAADRRSLRLANQLVQNPAGAACLECTLVGPRLKLLRAVQFAITGAEVAATLDGRPVAMFSAVEAPGGAVLKLASARGGLRSYIAFAGGIDGEVVLGSRSSDLRSGIGRGPLVAEEALSLCREARAGGAPSPEPVAKLAPGAGADAVLRGAERSLRVRLGPRDDRFTAQAIERLLTQPFRVSADCDRVGVRLEGPALTRPDTGELPSEGLVPGAIQVPGDGQPIVMLADHPTTGGYPVIAVIAAADLWAVGQLRPGQLVRFRR